MRYFLILMSLFFILGCFGKEKTTTKDTKSDVLCKNPISCAAKEKR